MLRDKVAAIIVGEPAEVINREGNRIKDPLHEMDLQNAVGKVNQIHNLYRAWFKSEMDKLTVLDDGSGEYFDELLQKMLGEVPQLRRLWTWKDDDGTQLQDNIKLGIVFDLLEHLHKNYQQRSKKRLLELIGE